jgi:hypothetical protein
MMKNKEEILALLKEEFNRWEELLSGMSEDQATNLSMPTNLSVKDVVAHLWAWQQRSIARMEAAILDREPEYPKWPEYLDPEAEDVDSINAWIYETYRVKPWSRVHQDWRDGYLHFLELGQQIAEKDLLDHGKYMWMEGYSLADVLLGSYEHHHEDHLVPLQAWLNQGGSPSGIG